jgi:hypothetical protein
MLFRGLSEETPKAIIRRFNINFKQLTGSDIQHRVWWTNWLQQTIAYY